MKIRKMIMGGVTGALLLGGLMFNFNLNDASDTNSWQGLQLSASNAIAQSESSDCPNGCLTYLGTCNCRGTHAYKEAQW